MWYTNIHVLTHTDLHTCIQPQRKLFRTYIFGSNLRLPLTYLKFFLSLLIKAPGASHCGKSQTWSLHSKRDVQVIHQQNECVSYFRVQHTQELTVDWERRELGYKVAQSLITKQYSESKELELYVEGVWSHNNRLIASFISLSTGLPISGHWDN